METIDTMQNGDIQQLRHPIAPITISDSRATDDAVGRGRLALAMDESQLYTNEHGQLCLMTPVEAFPAEMGEIGTPLTFDFEKMRITHGTKAFRFPSAPNITGTGPITVENNVIGLNLSDSFVLEGSMDGDENQTSSLELKYPLLVTGDLPSDPRAPLTFNFQNGEISRGNVTFPLSNSNVSIEQIPKSITTNSCHVQSQNIVLHKINNMLYLSGFVTLVTSSQAKPETRMYNISFPSVSVTRSVNGSVSGFTSSSNVPYFKFNTNNSAFILMNMLEIQNATTFTLNFSHIIGYI